MCQRMGNVERLCSREVHSTAKHFLHFIDDPFVIRISELIRGNGHEELRVPQLLDDIDQCSMPRLLKEQ